MSAPMKLSILNGRLIDPAGGLTPADGSVPTGGSMPSRGVAPRAGFAPGGGSVPGDGSGIGCALHIAGARIVGIGEAPAGFVADHMVDARGCIVAPGLLDLAARLREPGYEYKATLESEIQAAVAGGVTGLACPPDTDPVLDEPGLVEMLKYRAQGLHATRVYPVGALTVGLRGEAITEMAELAEAGCVGFSQVLSPILDTQMLMRAMQYAATYGFVVWLHPQDPHLARGGVAHAGPHASRLGLAGVPVIAETIALNTIFDLVRVTGCRVHLCRLSSAAGLELVRRARAEGLPLSCDVAVHHLHITDADIGFFDSNCRVDPPFRSALDRAAIRTALADGTIDAICSDHTPVDDDGKQLPFGEAEPGVTGLELLLPLTLKWAEESGVSLERALSRITCGAASVLGVAEATGRLEVGGAADLCIFDPHESWTVSSAVLHSQGTHTPYLGHELQGRVRLTLIGGRIVYQRNVGDDAAMRAGSPNPE
jgi:dihydroorotase